MKIRLCFFVWLVYCFFYVSSLEAEHKTLNIAQGYIAADILPLWMAKERNLFEKHGLATDITYVRGGKNIVAALLSGQSDMAVKEVIPSASRMAILLNPGNPTCSLQMKELAAVAPALGVTLLSLEVQEPNEITSSFSSIQKQRAGALIVCGDRMFNTHRKQIFDLSNQNRLPAIYSTKEYPENGGLMSYGANFPDLYRRAASTWIRF